MGHNAILLLFVFVVLVLLFVLMVRFVVGRLEAYSTVFNNTIGQNVFYSLTYLDNYIHDSPDPVTVMGVKTKLDYLTNDPIYRLQMELVENHTPLAHAVVFKTRQGVVVHRALYQTTLFAK
jgi:hypothetical protein